MAKAKTEKTATDTKVAVVPKGGALALPNYGDQMVGAGWDNAGTGDFQIPFLNQLQALSPQCTEGEDAYNANAKPGMFMNSVTQELYDGSVHLLVALTKHSFVEWKPQDSGGGFVGEHALDSDVIKKAKETAKDPIDLRSAAGNELVETFQLFCLIIDGPNATEIKDQVVISCSKTKIKRYKQTMTRLRTFKGSSRIPLFAHRLVMTATNEKNAAGKPYKNIQINPAIENDVAKSLLPSDSPLLELANGLREALLSGTAKANFDSAKAGAAQTNGKDEAADEVFA